MDKITIIASRTNEIDLVTQPLESNVNLELPDSVDSIKTIVNGTNQTEDFFSNINDTFIRANLTDVFRQNLSGLIQPTSINREIIEPRDKANYKCGIGSCKECYGK